MSKQEKYARKKAERRAKHERLLRMFDGDGYEVFDAGKYVFIKQHNGNNDKWEVAIYTKGSYKRMQKGREQMMWGAEEEQHIRSILQEGKMI